MTASIVGVLFDGVAYGCLLFLIGIGLSVTMGLMRFVNLAHGAFAAFGGYVCATAMNSFGLPFLATLPLAFVVAALVGGLLERTLYRRLYRATALDQVLFSIGLVFMAVAAMTYVWGAGQQPVRLPAVLLGQVSLAGIDVGIYRLFLIVAVVVIAATLGLLFGKTRFGVEVRAAVDDPRAAAGLGIDVDRLFALTFMLGSGLAGLGGALGIEILGLDPGFPIKFLVFFLLVVVVGGAGSLRGTLMAALTLGVFDVAGKYYLPEVGAFVIYLLMLALPVLFPAGLGARRT